MKHGNYLVNIACNVEEIHRVSLPQDSRWRTLYASRAALYFGRVGQQALSACQAFQVHSLLEDRIIRTHAEQAWVLFVLC